MPARSLTLPPTIARARWQLSLPSGDLPGELALAARWSRELDAELPPDLRFRAVLLTSQRGRVQPENPQVFIVSSAPPRQAATRVLAEPPPRYGVAAEVRLAVQATPGLPLLRRRANDLLRLHAYLSAAVLPPQQEVLLLDRLSLLAQLSPVALLQLGFAASFAAKLADTCGSEIGKRWGRHTVLITSLKPVPPGTEGAISVEGTAASLLGSAVMAALMLRLGLLSDGACWLLVTLVGLVATLLESWIGAALQQRWRWLSNELVNAIQTLLAAVLAMALAQGLGLV